MRNGTRWLACAALTGILLLSGPALFAGRARPVQGGKETPTKREDPERAIGNVIRAMQQDLEAGSSRGILSSIDSAKFDDYPRFSDMVDRLSSEDAVRVSFRQANNSIQEDHAQTTVDAEMELTHKDAAGAPERRRQQLVIDFERTARGWKIVNITPRDFFRPL